MKNLNFLADVYLDKVYKKKLVIDNYIFNLEYPISNRGVPAKNKINLIQSKSYIKATFGKNPIAVNLANNHIMDYGEDAFEDTINFLEKNEIKYFGAGKASNNYNNPLNLSINEKSIALFGYSCETTSAVFGDKNCNGSALLDLERIQIDIENCDADFKVVQLHWGMEEIPFPKYQDVVKARKIIDFGADIIIGHHAHVLQPTEDYLGKKIFYGIGNCIFPDFKMPSYFDGSKFTKISKKKQSRHNKQSMIITIDEDFNITNGCIELKKNTLVPIDNDVVPQFVPESPEEFIIRLIKKQRIMMLKNIWLNPRRPTLRHLKKLVGLST